MRLYTPLVNRALNIAYNAHDGQFDDNGAPYLYHPAFLVKLADLRCNGEPSRNAVKLLEDCVTKRAELLRGAKPLETAERLDKVFMYLTGRRGAGFEKSL